MVHVLDALGRAFVLALELVVLLSAGQRLAPIARRRSASARPTPSRDVASPPATARRSMSVELAVAVLVTGLALAFGRASLAEGALRVLGLTALITAAVALVASRQTLERTRDNVVQVLASARGQAQSAAVAAWSRLTQLGLWLRAQLAQLRRRLRAPLRFAWRRRWIVVAALALGLTSAFVPLVGHVIAGALIGLLFGVVAALPGLRTRLVAWTMFGGAVVDFLLYEHGLPAPGFVPTLVGVLLVIASTFVLPRGRRAALNLNRDEERRWLSVALFLMATGIATVLGFASLFAPLWLAFLAAPAIEVGAFVAYLAVASLVKLRRHPLMRPDWRAHTDSDRHPWRWRALAAICIGLFLVVLDMTILNVALISVQRALGASEAQLTWIVDAYTLAFTALLLVFGGFADRFGRCRLFVLGLAVFAGGALLAPAVHSAVWLIAMRAVMGTGAAAVMPPTLSTVNALFARDQERRTATVWRSLVGVVALACGPVLGGALIQEIHMRDSWHWVFYASAAIAAIGMFAAMVLVPDTKAGTSRRTDWRGFALSVAGLTAIVAGIIQAPASGWANPVIIAALTGGAILIAGFVLTERRVTGPMLDLTVFQDRRYSAAVGSNGLVYAVVAGLLFLLVTHLQVVLAYNPFVAGYRMLWAAAGMVLGTILFVLVERRVGFKVVMAAGFLIILGGTLYFAGGSLDSGFPLVLVALLLDGVGAGLVLPPVSQLVVETVRPDQESVGTAVREASTNLGQTLSVSVASAVAEMIYRSKVGPLVRGLPAAVRGPARDHVAAAVQVPSLAHAARVASVQSMDVALRVLAGAAALGAVIVLLWISGRALGHDSTGTASLRSPQRVARRQRGESPGRDHGWSLSTIRRRRHPAGRHRRTGTPISAEGHAETPIPAEGHAPRPAGQHRRNETPTPPEGHAPTLAEGHTEAREGERATIERETNPGPYDPDDWPKHLVTVRSSDGSWRRIWVHDTGPGADDRVPLVLIGGLGLSVYETFGSFVPTLARSHRVLAIDHPGHGGGPRDRSLGADGGPRGSDDILGEAEANIVAILGTLGVERAMIVGHSAGGAVAQKLARDYPDLVERLVLVGSAMTFEDRRLRPIGLINHLPRWMRQLIAPVVFLTFAAGFGEWRRTDVHHGHPWLMFEFAAALWRFNSSTWAADLEPPAFVLVLEHDRTIRPDAQRKLAETLRAQRVWSIESGHNLRAPSRLAPRRPRTKEWKAWRDALLGALHASPDA